MPPPPISVPGSALQLRMTTICLVRHADVNAGADQLNNAGQARAKELIHVLGQAGLAEIYASQFQRTQQTVQPLAQQLGQTVHVINASDVAGLVQHIRANHADGRVLVAGHSDSVPQIIAQFGGGQFPNIQPTEFDKLFVVTVTKLLRATVQVGPISVRIPERSTTRVLQMQYGATSP